MNKILEKYARDYLKTNLEKCTIAQINIFKRMYSHTNLGADINDVVDSMPAEKLDWAMTQIQNTIEKQENV